MSNDTLNNEMKSTSNILSRILRSDPEFENKEEFIDLHNKNLILEEQIKFRKQTDLYYSKLKYEKICKFQEKLKIKNEIAYKRNNEFLEQINENNLKVYDIKMNTDNSRRRLKELYQRYTQYIIYNQRQISQEILAKAIENQNSLVFEKVKAEKEVLMAEKFLEYKKNYYKQFAEKNEELLKQIEKLNDKKEKYSQFNVLDINI